MRTLRIMVLVVVVDTMEEVVALGAEVDVLTFIPVGVDHLILKVV